MAAQWGFGGSEIWINILEIIKSLKWLIIIGFSVRISKNIVELVHTIMGRPTITTNKKSTNSKKTATGKRKSSKGKSSNKRKSPSKKTASSTRKPIVFTSEQKQADRREMYDYLTKKGRIKERDTWVRNTGNPYGNVLYSKTGGK